MRPERRFKVKGAPLRQAAKKVAISFSLSAAVLSIANVDTIWEERAHRQDYEVVRQVTRQKLHAHFKQASGEAKPESRLEQLRFVLAQDELGLRNPYAELSSLAPLTELLKKGVRDFTRQAFRSPQYKEEVGYDLVAYEIEHDDGARSRVLAYLEAPLGGGDLVPVVVVMRASGEGARQALYRAGKLVEESDVTLLQAQNLVHQRLSAGIPFMSVSR